MDPNQRLHSRREMMGGLAAAAVAAFVPGSVVGADEDPQWKVKNGRINQSVVQWCMGMDVESLAKASAEMGVKSVELIDPKDWSTLKKYGLTCAIAGSHGFVKGFNHVENHEMCIDKVTKSIDACAAFGCPNVITFSGMREGISDEDGIKNMVEGIKKVVGHAEKNKITICIEVLNSRVNEKMKGHPDYQADKLEWAVQVCDKVGSDRFKILFDIYHIQIMEGDVITRLKQYKDYIGHYHTAGVPGRNELDDTQEVNYPPIMKAIVDTGYKGFVAQEFIPKYPDKVASLRQAVKLCDV